MNNKLLLLNKIICAAGIILLMAGAARAQLVVYSTDFSAAGYSQTSVAVVFDDGTTTATDEWFGSTNGIGISGGDLTLANDTQNRFRGSGVWLDATGWAAGTVTVEVDVANYVAGADTNLIFQAYAATGVDAANSVSLDLHGSVAAGAQPVATGTAAISALGSEQTITANGTDVAFTFTYNGTDDFVGLTFVQVNAIGGSAFGSADIDNLTVTVAEGQPPETNWMSGKWGIGWRINADGKTNIENYNVSALVSQVQAIGDVEYVLFNLSDAAHGDAYLAPHSVLTAINPGSTPNNDRDLFMELAQGFQAAGIKVIAYCATQGPAMLKHGAKVAYDSVDEGGGVFSSVAMDNWSDYVLSVYGDTEIETFKTAYAEVIIDEYAQRYGTLIDGWWFDHAGHGNIPLLHDIVTSYNPNTVISFNTGQHIPLTNNNPDYENFTSGHPTPIARVPASDVANLPMLTSLEGTPDGYFYDGARRSLGHMFMPMQTRWNSGDIVWTLEQAVDWQGRATNAGGAWTWNVDTDDRNSQLALPQVAFMESILAELATPAQLLGDVNLDGVIDFLDIPPFISLLTNDGFQLEADVNQDGAVNFVDIPPFIAILINN